MTLAFYLDEDSMDAGLIKALRSRRVDVVSALEAGLPNQPDDKHLDFAAREARVLYSANAHDFCRIHTERLRRGESHSGTVVVEQQRYTIDTRLHALLNLAAQRSAVDMRGRL